MINDQDQSFTLQNSQSTSDQASTTITSSKSIKLQETSSVVFPPHRHRVSEVSDALDPPAREDFGISDASSLASVNAPPDAAEVDEAERTHPPASAHAKVYPPFAFPVIASLMPTSVFGVLARLGILALTNYDGRSIFPLAWVQGAGCLLMGFALGSKDSIGTFYGPLYTAITTGFCGSLTTFSSWQLEVFLSWANSDDAHRDWFRDVIDGIANTVFTLAISLSAVTLGLHIAHGIGRFTPVFPPPGPFLRHTFTAVCVMTYAATLPVYFLLSADFRHQATAAMLFSFPGTLTRYVLAMTLTPRTKFIPLGTFVANTAGTALVGVFHVLQRAPRLPSANTCSLLQGLMDGYCGCLTTVSTFAVEVGALKRRRAWLYVALSWIVSQLLLLVIIGPSWLNRTISESRVCDFN